MRCDRGDWNKQTNKTEYWPNQCLGHALRKSEFKWNDVKRIRFTLDINEKIEFLTRFPDNVRLYIKSLAMENSMENMIFLSKYNIRIIVYLIMELPISLILP